jgi:hypothetical protein
MAEQDYIHMPAIEEYSECFKNFFQFKRSDDGILEVKMRTFGGHVHWSYQMHHAISELWTAVGHDTNNEVLIFTERAGSSGGRLSHWGSGRVGQRVERHVQAGGHRQRDQCRRGC